MYSVLRFSDPSQSLDLEKCGQEVNECAAGLFTGMDRIKHRLSCSLSTDDNWKTQCEEIIRTIGTCMRVVEHARSVGIEVDLDLAIDPDDYMGSLFTEVYLEKRLLEILCRADIPMTISIYGRGRGPEEEPEERTGRDSF